MKKRLLLAFTLLMAVTTLFAERVSEEDAALVANNFMSVSASASGAKRTSKKMVLKKSAKAASESQFYVYENPDGGWVMVAADDVANPILAYSQTGYFHFENMPANVKAWLEGYEHDIKTAAKAGLQADEETATEWTNLKKGLRKAGTPVVANLIKTKWDQDGIYSSKCPYDETAGENTAVGCVATAMAQIMKYWEWPDNGEGSHSYNPLVCANSSCTQTKQVYARQTVDFGATTYDWANMLNTYYNCTVNNQSVSCTEVSFNTAQGEAIATLMWHCGVAVEMMYDIGDNGGSGAYTIGTSEPSAELALPTYFRYKSSLQGLLKDDYGDTQWKNLLKAELDANRPMIYAGGAHCFICDGYDDSNYFRFNWGWSGIDDGFYQLTALKPTTMYGTGGSDYNFTDGQEAIIGIEPDRPTVAVTGINVTPAILTLKINEKQTLSAAVEPTDAQQTVTWSSTNEAVATVTSAGVVKGVAQGTANIKATATDGSDIVGVCQVEVTSEVLEVKGYVLSTIDEISATDEVVITMSKDGKTYALSNDNGTSKAPTAIEVTVTDEAIEEAAANIIWNVSNDNGTLQFTIDDGAKAVKYLYTTNANNGVRVGTNDNKDWTMESGYLKNSGTGRYMGVYNSADWRAYTTVNNNISGQTLAFYAKAVSDPDPTNPEDPQTCTITWMVCGLQYGDVQTVNKGSELVLPATPDAKEGRQFYGWVTDQNYESTSAPTLVEAGTEVSENVTYYAVFK